MDGECAQHGSITAMLCTLAVQCVAIMTLTISLNYYDSHPVDILEMLTVERHNSATSWNSN